MEAARPAGAGRVLEALSRGLPADRIVADPDVLAAISRDDAEWAPVGRAAAAVRARSEAEVQHVVRVCAELAAPIVPRGAGTGLSGGTVSGEHGIGILKRDGVRRELDPGALAMQDAVRRALDPLGCSTPARGNRRGSQAEVAEKRRSISG